MSTSISSDAWLPPEGSGRVITVRLVDDCFPNTISDLIYGDTGTWQMELLSQYLWPCDITRAIKVPLDPSKVEDISFWCFSKDERFTVRSCYHHIFSRETINEVSSSGHSLAFSPEEWRWIWGLQLPPKIRTFLWRACNDFLPMSSTLTRRHLGGDPYCPLCYTSLESTAHPFFECSRLVKIWKAESFNIVLPRSHTNFVEWLRFLHSRLDNWVFTLACVVCWRIIFGEYGIGLYMERQMVLEAILSKGPSILWRHTEQPNSLVQLMGLAQMESGVALKLQSLRLTLIWVCSSWIFIKPRL